MLLGTFLGGKSSSQQDLVNIGMSWELFATLLHQRDWNDHRNCSISSMVDKKFSTLTGNAIKNAGNNLFFFVKLFSWNHSQYTNYFHFVMKRWLHHRVICKHTFIRNMITCLLQWSSCSSDIYFLCGMFYIMDIRQEMHWKSLHTIYQYISLQCYHHQWQSVCHHLVRFSFFGCWLNEKMCRSR